MDVRCSRCGTEYDFDDALVSERGTTVKCTNCGHQFKVYPGGQGGAPERWIVRKASGRELVYTSLRDLQRAIAQRQVGPTDLLSRGGSHPVRQLGTIAELEPFFQAQGPAPTAAPTAASPAEVASRTLLGISPSGRPPAEDTVPDQGPYFDETVAAPRAPAAPAARASTSTPVGGLAAPGPRRSVPPPPNPPPNRRVAEQQPYARYDEPEPKTVPRNELPQPMAEPPPPATLGSASHAHVHQADPRVPQHTPTDGMNAAFRAYQDSFSDESLPTVASPPRKSALRWVVGLVIVGGLAFVGGTVGVKYVKKLSASPVSSAAVRDDRVPKLLEQGDADLSRGDFESAKEQYDKASALAERDSAVLSALARLEASRADVHWLALKAADPANSADVEAEMAELANRLARVKKAAEAAAAVAPGDPAVMRARIDALRLGGDLTAARELVGTLGADTSQPETAYVLAALDLAEKAPAWATVVDRLRSAASAERGLGRARAALVYALATSGATDDAKTELGKLEASGPSFLLGRLKAYVQRVSGGAVAAPSGAIPLPSASASAAAALPAPGSGEQGEAPSGESVPRGMDFRRLLEDASAAKQGGDLGRAEALYRAAQEQQPGNIEAVAGLGDVARLRGDTTAAAGYYEAVLQQNPTYLPAMIAAADIKWSKGDRSGALTLYKRVANQADPGSPYGQRAAARLAEAQGSGSSAATREDHHETPKPSPPSPSPSPAPAGDTPSNIDTSDLPGFR